jgi:RNA polymerase sigma-70 factor, ECF subfamily
MAASNCQHPQPPVTSVSIEDLMQHADSLYRYALARVKNHHAAEDLVQDCLSAAWQRIDSFDGRSSLSTWLIGIMKFKVIDHFRKSKRTPTDQAADPGGDHDPLNSVFDSCGAWKIDPNHGLEMLASAPDQIASKNELLDWVRACLDKLPERLRVLFTLREVDGLDVPSAASAAGVTAGSAAVLLTRTRHRLRSCLQEHGIQP